MRSQRYTNYWVHVGAMKWSFPEKSKPIGCLMPNGQPWKYIYKYIVSAQYVVFRNMYVCASADKNAITIIGNRMHESEGELGRIYERIWRRNSN